MTSVLLGVAREQQVEWFSSQDAFQVQEGTFHIVLGGRSEPLIRRKFWDSPKTLI